MTEIRGQWDPYAGRFNVCHLNRSFVFETAPSLTAIVAEGRIDYFLCFTTTQEPNGLWRYFSPVYLVVGRPRSFPWNNRFSDISRIDDDLWERDAVGLVRDEDMLQPQRSRVQRWKPEDALFSTHIDYGALRP